MRTIILASASPRRKELLRRIGLEFSVSTAHAEEVCSARLSPRDCAKALARHKAACVAQHYPHDLILAADTIVVLGNDILNKPVDAGDARRMLKRLSGRCHVVITAYTILDASSGKSRTRAVESKVWFRRLTALEIEAYIKTGEPFDKAGAYGIQEFGALLVRKIDGDYFNVMGLPIASLAHTLKEFGIEVL
ncbi:MAG TPA: Maf family protein [Dissulfurispiraceae bacterium]|nr:Maf family protein [Dissulfurispiraceae bacterium]